MNENIISKSYEDFKALSPQFTGERYTLGSGIRIAYEHFNRYCFAYNNIAKNDTVLDLACGTGYGSILLAQKAKAVYAVDIDQTSLDLLSLVCKKHNIVNVFPVKCDINQIENCPDLENITAVVCHELIEHIAEQDQHALLRKISTATKPFTKDCRLFVSTPEKQAYNSVNLAHNEFHLKELTKKEFSELVNSYFKQSKFFWQMPISGDLIAPFDSSDKTNNTVSFLNWTDSLNLVGFPSAVVPEQTAGIYMYAAGSNTELKLDANLSLIIDAENRELQERFVIAAEELKNLQVQLAKPEVITKTVESDSSAEQKLLVASSKKIKNLIFETEKAAAQKVLLENKVASLEQELARVRPISKCLNNGVLDSISQDPKLLDEAIAYYGLRNRFAHRLGNYILFNLQNKKPIVLLNRFYKFAKLVKAS